MIQTYQLSNGLTVVTENLPHVASATAGVWVRAGAVEEKPKIFGISHFIEHMMFKGTENRTYRQLSEDVEKFGGNMNAFTGKESTCYYVKSLSAHLTESIDVLADMMTHSLYDAAEMEKEKNVIIEEMKMIEDVPDDFGQDLITEAIFEGTPLANRTIGSRESVRGIYRADIMQYLSERYTADKIVVSVAGQFDEAVLREMLEKSLGEVPADARKQGKQVSVPLLPRVPHRISQKRDIEQTHLFLGTKGVAFEDDDFYALTLYSSILGGGMSSRLFQSVREEKGLAYSIYASDAPFVDDGQFVIYAGVADEKLVAAVGAIKEEILLLAETDVPSDELSRVKEQFKGSYIFRRENNSSRMLQAGRNMLLLGKQYTEDEILNGIDAVTAADIRRLSQNYADFSSYSAVAIGGRDVDMDRLLK
ncbi:MAG: insulinase family protein [Clostridiales Family XIII bacterium]|nr:insulinase family protein [Clostridiales Family XIII bacterium]